MSHCGVSSSVLFSQIEEWPFEAFCELLEGELFSPVWERRHGAATGLRQVVRIHGHGAGRSSDTPSDQVRAVDEVLHY